MEGRRAREQTFSTRSAARILAVSPDRIRYWVKTRLIKPARASRGSYQFAFNDLLVMRLTKELLPNHKRLQPIRQCFERLGKLINPNRPLTSLKLFEEDGHIVARDGGVKFEPDSGQLLLDFNVERFARDVRSASFANYRGRELMSSAQRSENDNPVRALELYKQVVEIDPGNAHAHLRLGFIYEEARDNVTALRHFLAAVSAEPHNSAAHLALGILYRRLNQNEEAMKCFLRTVHLDPEQVEAHRHLAELYELAGRKHETIRHLNAVRRLTRQE